MAAAMGWGDTTAVAASAVAVAAVTARRGRVELPRVLWVKTTDPGLDVGELERAGAGVDVRVVLPSGRDFAGLADRLLAAGVAFRRVRWWAENDRLDTRTPLPRWARGWSAVSPSKLGLPDSRDPLAVRAGMYAYTALWDAHTAEATASLSAPVPAVPAGELVPAAWVHLLPYPGLNPAQAQAAPVLLRDDGHVLVVAPTGAGKTVMGMLAALKAITAGRKAVWLVPQRSLTEELGRDLAGWRAEGLRVERLSGDTATDLEAVRGADLWVATTEKFEALCRTASLREAIADVGVLVVDEIHLLGDPGRGPTLEALLARVRGTGSPVRLVGLSATVANAEEIAGWMGATEVRIGWRPSRLTWQALRFPAAGDRSATDTTRARVTVELTRGLCADGGSVLVFCGTKQNVRVTALAIAADRGADLAGVNLDDVAGVERVCAAAGVGLHYSDWPGKHEAERAFRARESSVLVATSTVAAGVNLPARAVIVRDTRVGRDRLPVSTVQQMFGRAGRVGAGEREGWAFLLTDDTEHASWVTALTAGYTVRSQLLATLADHVLAETVQGRLATAVAADAWYAETLAFAQGEENLEHLHTALGGLVGGRYVTTPPAGAAIAASVPATGAVPVVAPVAPAVAPGGGVAPAGDAALSPPAPDVLPGLEVLPGGGGAAEGLTVATAPELATAPAGSSAAAGVVAGDWDLVATPLGQLTCRMMLPTDVGAELRRALWHADVPAGPAEAEETLIGVLAVVALGGPGLPADLRPAVARVLLARGDVTAPRGPAHQAAVRGLAAPMVDGVDLAVAALLLVANSPQAFTAARRVVGGLPTSVLWPVLEEAPRWLGWLAGQGFLGTVPPWVAVVAHDLGHRVTWRQLGADRGSGRLLWMLEQLATRAQARALVPRMWQNAVGRGLLSPDWPVGPRPRGTVLEEQEYVALCRDRAGEVDLAVTAEPAAGELVWTLSGVPVGARVMLVDGVVRVVSAGAGGGHGNGDAAASSSVPTVGGEASVGPSARPPVAGGPVPARPRPRVLSAHAGADGQVRLRAGPDADSQNGHAHGGGHGAAQGDGAHLVVATRRGDVLAVTGWLAHYRQAAGPGPS